MNIQINTDKNISGNEKLEGHLKSIIKESVARFSDHITRIEVHLSDENSHKKGVNDKRCMLEARVEGRQPIAVTSHADTMEDAVNDALDKLKTLLDKIYSQIQEQNQQGQTE